MNSLNHFQNEAVHYQGGHLLIVAGPGTGKTHTLTHRIKQSAKGLKSTEKILAITFTNKAAEEMKERLKLDDDPAPSRFVVGTFHQFCLDILKTYSDKLNLSKDFRVAEPEEVYSLVKNIWPDKTRKEVNRLLDEISRWKSAEFDTKMPEVVILCNQKLREVHCLDFDDLLFFAWQLFNQNKNILGEVTSQYKFIFVDEYQDINCIQHVLLKILVQNEVCLTAIGDPNQAIYGFRGSNVAFFKSFQNDFKGAKVLRLSENYRSFKNILSASSQVMANAQERHVPELTAKLFEEGRLIMKECPTDKAEAEFVVHNIEKMIGGTSMFSQDSGRVETDKEGEASFGDIAVLYRLKAQSFCLKEAFERSGIPYYISGQKMDEDTVCPPRAEDLDRDAEKVSLMTLHAAKGLEFSVVFIVGCEEGLLPLSLLEWESDKEEERRLFYVGMTRAKTHLYLVRAKTRRLFGKIYHLQESPFLHDIEEDLKVYEKTDFKKNQKKNDEQMTLF